MQENESLKQKHLQDEISISFCISDNYAQHLAVVATSILRHTPRKVVFHVLARDLSNESQQRLNAMTVRYGERCRFCIHLVDGTLFDRFPLPSVNYITQETYYRFLLPEILKEECRTIYMDVDMVVREDITPLWEWDLQGSPLAGVIVPKGDSEDTPVYKQRLGMKSDSKYFNAGLLVMDLNQLRELRFTVRCMENTQIHHAKLCSADQDVINLTMEGQIFALPTRYNCMELDSMSSNESICVRHFASLTAKPWCYLYKNKTWWEYVYYLWYSSYRDRVLPFIGLHLKGFFYFRYTKNKIERILICGILIRKRYKG